jgi:RNase P subunit RPR2
MQLFCKCGYPITATALWDGNDFRIRLHDGNESNLIKTILVCPRCGAGISLGGLRPGPRRKNYWFYVV